LDSNVAHHQHFPAFFSGLLKEIENLEVDAGLTYIDNEPLGRVTSIALYREEYRFLTSEDALLGDRQSVSWAEVGKARCEEGQRDRHMDVALAAGLPYGDAFDRRGAALDLGDPLSCARDRGDELDPGVGADRTGYVGLSRCREDKEALIPVVPPASGTARAAASQKGKNPSSNKPSISARITVAACAPPMILTPSPRNGDFRNGPPLGICCKGCDNNNSDCLYCRA
jgi:hypothetical protein